MIRLGESNEAISYDYGIEKIDVHNLYRFPEKYHDLAVSCFLFFIYFFNVISLIGRTFFWTKKF